jgi:hypothetical protein
MCNDRSQGCRCHAACCLSSLCVQVALHWQDGGPPEQVLVSHMRGPGPPQPAGAAARAAA